MILCPDGWRQHRSGTQIVLLPPPRFAGLRIFYMERQYPLRSLSHLVEETLAADGGFEPAEKLSDLPERLVTSEGEYAAVVDLLGTAVARADSEVQRSVGAVFAEDFSTWLDVVCVRPSLFAQARELCRELLLGEQLLLGVRRRRFLFTPPAGWHALAEGLTARFYPPNYPRDATVLTVWPAQPLEATGASWHETVARGGLASGPADQELELVAGPHRLVSSHGLQGLYSRIRARIALPDDEEGAPRTALVRRTLATFQDRQYGYALCCETPESLAVERQHQILLAVAGSVQPLPTSQLATPPSRSDQILKMWGG